MRYFFSNYERHICKSLHKKQDKTEEKHYRLICICSVKSYASKIFQNGLFLNKYILILRIILKNFNTGFEKTLMHSIFSVQ